MRFKYRISVLDENTLEEAWHVRLSRLSIFLYVCVFIIVTFLILAVLIYITPLRYYLPGYGDEGNRETVIAESMRADSLQTQMERQMAYLDVIRDVIAGNLDTSAIKPLDSVVIIDKKDVPGIEQSERERQFVARFEQEEKYNLAVLSNATPKNDTYVFFRPVRGIVQQHFDALGQAYGVSILTSPGESVLSVLDGTVVIYPEAGHQDKHWLGQFSLAYLHILFEAARKTGFQKEMFVLPSCNHYSDYFHAREKMLVCYGTPISLAPYYELYQTRPRTAQRQVNQLVRQQISSMMLNITDLEHYAAIDFIRETYGIDYARRKGLDPDNLPQKLEADKMLVKRLDEAKAADEETVTALYTAVDRFRQQLDALRVADHAFRRPGSAGLLAAKGAGFALLFPVFAVACVPNLLVYYAPTLITKRVKDRFLHSGFDFGVSALVSVPVLYTLTCGIVWSATQSLWIALICLGGLPLMGIFMYFYMKKFKAYKVQLRFHRLRRKGLLGDLAEQRAWIHSTIDNILKQFS